VEPRQVAVGRIILMPHDALKGAVMMVMVQLKQLPLSLNGLFIMALRS